MAGDDNNKNDGGSSGITYELPYYLHPSDYPKQLHENRTPHESAAFKAFQRCNGPPGVNKERSRAKSVEEENKHCTECNKDGHTRESCFKLIGYPEWWPGKKGEKNKGKAAYVKTKTSLIPGLTYEDYQLFLKHFSGTGNSEGTKPVANMAHKEDEEGEWIFDSGCTEYITYLSDILVNKKTTHFEAPVVIPNGDSIPVKGKGDYILPGGTKVNGVLYVPDFKCNLLSVSRLSRDLQCCISFFPDFCVMQGLQRKNLIGAGRCEGGLYRMKMVQGRRAMATTVETWHKRLGHASKGKLGKIDFIKTCTIDFNNFCHSCAKAKHIRTPFPSSCIKTNAPFQLIHCDIWGGYRVPSYTGANYFLTIVDDFSRAVWVFLIKHKSEASKRLIDFHKMIEVQFEKQIKRIRCDNGGEFTSNNMLNFYNEKGILLETTCPHTPQQNGVVERKHRHLLETARALMFDANLPKQFWGECILTAAYVINRLPSKVIKNKTPFELLMNQKPDYEFLRVFGCLAYFTNTNTKGDKFEERGKPGVFLGYLTGTKGYKILDLETRKIIVSRNVNFYEQKFPFKNIEEINKDCVEEPIICHDCDCHDEPILAQNKEQNPMEQDQQMDHDQTNEPSGPHETHDGDETGQINDEGQPNNDEIETNEGGEAQVETRPTRPKTQPSRFKDFVVQVPPSLKHPTSTSNQVTSTVRYPISNFVSYDKFSTNHKGFLAAITNNEEPKCFKQAAQDARWCEAMQKEVKALEKNSAWTLEYLPKGKRAIDLKWVYKIKFKPNGEVEKYKARLVEKYKARLVAKVFNQMKGVDYHGTFAPVTKLVTVRTLLAIAVKWDWIIHQLYVNSAFLNGDLDEEVYMKIPQGFSNDNETRVCRLRKSLYGLKQASRNCIKDLGPLKYFLGIKVAKTRDGLVLSQRKYTLDILEDRGKLGCKPSAFPIEEGLKLDNEESESRVDAKAANHVLGYLKATPGQGIILSRAGDPVLTAYCDSDWLGCPYTRRSRTGYLLLLGGTPISWRTKKQSVVSHSSAEAEYKAMASIVSEIIWVRWLLSELHVHNLLATHLFCDNQAARHIANNPVFHERTKHVEMDCYFVCERVKSKEIIPMKISSKMQIAELLTKGLPAHQHQFLLGKIGITDLDAPS
ncbi:retrovirus-related pol polyprotein from transposon TNT 1-94 [Tanacetum coccineum]